MVLTYGSPVFLQPTQALAAAYHKRMNAIFCLSQVVPSLSQSSVVYDNLDPVFVRDSANRTQTSAVGTRLVSRHQEPLQGCPAISVPW